MYLDKSNEQESLTIFFAQISKMRNFTHNFYVNMT